jgi:hypothetical protein
LKREKELKFAGEENSLEILLKKITRKGRRLLVRCAPDNTSLKCYLGIAYLAGGYTQEAKTIFEGMVHEDTRSSKEVAEWNLAMTYLKLDDGTSLKKTLEGIIQQKDHQHGEQAEELLTSM